MHVHMRVFEGGESNGINVCMGGIEWKKWMKECAYLWRRSGCKLASKRREGERGWWITSCSIVLGRRGDWGWSLEIATGDQVIQSFKWLSENQSNSIDSLHVCLTHSLPMGFACIHCHTHIASNGVTLPAWLICFHVPEMQRADIDKKRCVKSDAMKGSQSEW